MSAGNLLNTQSAEVALKKYELLAEKARDIFLFVDMDGTILEANEAALRAYGYSREEILTKTIFDLRGEDTLVKEQMRLAKTEGLSFEAVHYRKDGSSFPVEVSVQSTVISGKDVLLSIIRDVTQRKQVEAQNREAMELAQAAYKAKSEFLANMSHEIRTPLNGVIGMIDLTMLTVLTEEQKDNLLTAKNCADSLLKIINDILDFSKIEAGKIKIETLEFDLGTLFEKMMKMHVLHASEKGLMLKMVLPGNLPARIKGDPSRLQQILNNLLSNAIKFTEKGTVCLDVHCLGNDGKTLCLQFDVADTGIGIAPEDTCKLFKSFSQVDGTHSRKYHGTGLGLAISRQLAEMMGGTLTVSSEKGKGSVFSLMMGFETVPGQQDPQPAPEPRRENNSGVSILLVEDDAVNRVVVSRMLKSMGYSFDVAKSGLECLSMLRGKVYDLCLMDIQMPDMDGIETTASIRSMEGQKGVHLPVVALTAHALLGDRERFIALGMDDYLAKPFQMMELQEAISRMLKRYPVPKAAPGAGSHESVSGIQGGSSAHQAFSQIQKAAELLDAEQDLDRVRTKAQEIRQLCDAIQSEHLKSLAFEMELASAHRDRASLSHLILRFNRILSLVGTLFRNP